MTPEGKKAGQDRDRGRENPEGMTFHTAGPEATQAFGARLAEGLEAGDFIALEGGLGAGKTCLVQGLALGLGYGGPVTSPTFSLLQSYEGGRLPLHHFDVYRLARPEELEGIGYEEYFYGDGVAAVEWSNEAAAYLPASRIELKLTAAAAQNQRRIALRLLGGREDWRQERLDRFAALLKAYLPGARA
jgi:tRNA threonylcarbamoyladenosine biosynthesis protein TsaE